MKPVDLVPWRPTLRGCAAAPRGGLRGASELDTYKQIAQPSVYAGSGPIEGYPMRPFIRAIRAALYVPLKLSTSLPLGPVHLSWLIRATDTLDAPLRAYLRGAYAKTR
jgi:hypothetical protein